MKTAATAKYKRQKNCQAKNTYRIKIFIFY